MDLSKRLLEVTRNLLLCFYLSGFFLFLVGWLWRLTPVCVFGIPLLFCFLWILLSGPLLQGFSLGGLGGLLKTIPSLPLCVLALFLTLNFLFCWLPPSEHVEADALLYNFTIPWQHYLRGDLSPLDWSMNDKFPMVLQMAQLPFTALCFPWIVKAVNIFSLPALVVVVWAFAELLGYSRKEAAWASAIITALALFVKQYGFANMDLVNCVYILLGVFYLVRASQSSKISDGIWGSLFLGMACAIKSFLFCLLFVWGFSFVVWKIFSKQRWSGRDGWLIAAPFFFAPIFMAPVLIRNALSVGNPFFPLFEKYFGPAIEHEMHHRVMAHAHYGYGYGHSPLDFLLMPFRMVWPIPNPILRFDYWTDPLLLLFLAAGLVSLRRRWKTPYGLASLIALSLYTFLFLGSQQARYFYPFWILVVLVGGQTVFRWLGPKLLKVALVGEMIVGLAGFFFFHRNAVANLKYIPQGEYLEHASFSYVWNKNLKGKKPKLLCLKQGPGDSIVDLLYFTVPIKIIGHTTSIVPFDSRFVADCDAFMIGTQWPHEKINTPEGWGEVVSRERFLNESDSK